MGGFFGLLLATFPPIVPDPSLRDNRFHPSATGSGGVDHHAWCAVLDTARIQEPFDAPVRFMCQAVLDSKSPNCDGIDPRSNLCQHNPVTARSCLSDMQTVVLLEAFHRYRARDARLENIPMSSQFRLLYSSVSDDPRPDSKRPTDGSKLLDEELLHLDSAMVRRVHLTANADTLYGIQRLWIDLEGRRRVLLFSFVLDIQHNTLFQQSSGGTLNLNQMYLPYPHPTETWDCSDIFMWRNLVSRHVQLDLGLLVNSGFVDAPVDAFQSSILSCYQVHRGLGCSDPATHGSHSPWYPSQLTHVSQTGLIHHALLLCASTPIKTLLIVSSGSWLFNTKVTEISVWEAAKIDLRAWVTTVEAARSVWHATQLLRLALSEGSLYLLQEQWCMYLAALVCWAYGFIVCPSQPVPDAITATVAVAQAWEYLTAMDVRDWEAIPQVPIRWQTRGVLECVRARIRGPLGGLLNQAEDVLAQLVEERNRYWEF
jgi:hypothetical protein